jgi:hypothetical protein
LTGSRYDLRDLWERRDRGPAESLALTLAPHGSVLYRLSGAVASGVKAIENGAITSGLKSRPTKELQLQGSLNPLT